MINIGRQTQRHEHLTNTYDESNVCKKRISLLDFSLSRVKDDDGDNDDDDDDVFVDRTRTLAKVSCTVLISIQTLKFQRV